MKSPLEFVEALVKDLVRNPDEVIVTEKKDEKGVLLTVKVAKSDLGSIIGKKGSTAIALRTITRVYASGQDHQDPVAVKISD